MNDYLSFLDMQRQTQLNATCLMAYMDAKLLPYQVHHGIRWIKRTHAKRLVKHHRRLTHEFIDFLITHDVDGKVIDQAANDREGQLYFYWLSLGKQLPGIDGCDE